jgi:hypothetical protein
MRHFATRGTAVVVAVLLLVGCTPSADQPADPAPAASSEAATSASRPAPPPRPGTGSCYRLRPDDAASPTSHRKPVPCRTAHTAVTFHVGRLDLRVRGRERNVDFPAVRARVADACATRLAGHVGGGGEALRLSMLTSVWFTPEPEEVDAGARWFRCDVVGLAGGGRLLPLPRDTRGLLGGTAGRGRFGLCGTAEPGSTGFARVPCQARHSWMAVAAVDLSGRDYPTAEQVADRMGALCRDEARARSSDPLDLTWSEERPTRAQWGAGRRYGICWVPA